MKSFFRWLWPWKQGEPQPQLSHQPTQTNWTGASWSRRPGTNQPSSPVPTAPAAPVPPSSTLVRREERLIGLNWQPAASRPQASPEIYTTNPDPESPAFDRGPILGIDLGTSSSIMAVVRDGRVEVIPNQEGERLTPSVVAFRGPFEVLVGALGQRQAITNPCGTITSVKRLLGDPAQIEVQGRRFTPTEITAYVLAKLRAAAESHLGRPVHRAVITVPAQFTMAQRQATLDAALLAGFHTDWLLQDPATGRRVRQPMRIVNEPTAAALARGQHWKSRRMLVFHMGGGTFDVSVLDIGDNVLEVKAVGGDTRLGGDDFDQALVDHLLQFLPPDLRRAAAGDPAARERLRQTAEQAKRELSQSTEAHIHLPMFGTTADGLQDLDRVVTRPQFEQLVAGLVRRCRETVEVTVRDAGYQSSALDEVLLIGGMTRMPCIQEMCHELFGQRSCRCNNPDEMVAVGAAILGDQLARGSRAEQVLLDVAPLALGLESADHSFTEVIPRNATIPCVRKVLATTVRDKQPGVSVRVLQRKDRAADTDRLLGELHLDGLALVPQRQPRIEVAFDLDHNGILRVSASDCHSDLQKQVRITVEEIPPVVRERWKLPAEQPGPRPDAQRTALDEVRDQASRLIVRTKRLLQDRDGRFGAADREALGKLLDRTQDAVAGDDFEALQRLLFELEDALRAVQLFLGIDLSAQEPRTSPIKDATQNYLRDVRLEID
jgi:molecular chaperone DnaK